MEPRRLSYERHKCCNQAVPRSKRIRADVSSVQAGIAPLEPLHASEACLQTELIGR